MNLSGLSDELLLQRRVREETLQIGTDAAAVPAEKRQSYPGDSPVIRLSNKRGFQIEKIVFPYFFP
ncbi:hypothetical protein SDC9_53172 [bioreactor metagenome]|uniref:Uncharacterized protein n=1 Tax=bioreactor metagenome TaxID=1076179 RepID=A0A644WT25_9ZZZZ